MSDRCKIDMELRSHKNLPNFQRKRKEMSQNVCLIGQIMYLMEGQIEPGDEAKVDRFERKISEWQRDAVGKN